MVAPSGIRKFRLLYVISVGMFHLGYPDRVQSCVPPARRRPGETAREFIERAQRENHGYTVPQRWLVDLDAVPDGEGGEPISGFMVGVEPSAAEKAFLYRRPTGSREKYPVGPGWTFSAVGPSSLYVRTITEETVTEVLSGPSLRL